MKKKVLGKIIFSFFLIIILCHSTSAIVGVSPASHTIDFEPNLEQDFSFGFIFDEGVKSELYVGGDLAEYVTLNKKSLTGGEGVIATLKLPSEIEVPGVHTIAIGARQIPPEGQGIGLVGDVRGLIRVKVPYPGKYAEIEFRTMDANAGEPVDFTVTVHNLGKENINAHTIINIAESEGEYVETLDLGSKFIETKTAVLFFRQLNTSNYKPGDYNATAIVSYDGQTAEAERVFRLGELYVEISNTTEEVERNKINRFDIQVESFWNDPIQNAFAEVRIVNHTISFSTPSVNINPWSRKILTGYFDTTPIGAEEFQAEITLHYEGETTKKIVDVKFKKEIDYMLYAIIAGSAVLVVIIIAALVIIIILLKRGKNEKGKRKKR